MRKNVVTPRGFATFARAAFTGVLRGGRLIRRHRPDLVFVNTLTIPLWIYLARLANKRTIVHVHEAEKSAPAIQRAVLAFPLLISQTIVANSRFSVDVLASSFRSLGRRATIVLNGVPGPTTSTVPRASLSGVLNVTYVGRLSPRKGVDIAVDAVARLNEQGTPATLTLLGAVFPGYEWYEKQLRTQVADLGLGERVRFLGFQPRVWDVIAEGDVVVVPSIADEPFGNTAVEAVLAARPVVASATSGLLEATSGFVSALTVTPDSATALADALAEIAGDWPNWRERAIADRSVADARHSPRAFQEQMARVLEING